MCDESTELDNERLLSRRKVLAGATAAALLVGCGSTKSTAAGGTEKTQPAADGDRREVLSRQVEVQTPDGRADGFFVAPKGGRHPAVVLWPDIAGLRPAFEQMGTRLAAAGYAVLVVNPYYRSAKGHLFEDFSGWRTEEGRAKVEPLRAQLTPEAVSRDAVALIAWLDAQPEVDAGRKVGVQGYCMSGSYGFRAAAASERVGAFASFHGGGLVTEEEHSPHRLLGQTTAAALICIAQNDHERDTAVRSTLEQTAQQTGTPAEITVYPANHGWCALDSPVYDEVQAERAWARLLSTYGERLV